MTGNWTLKITFKPCLSKDLSLEIARRAAIVLESMVLNFHVIIFYLSTLTLQILSKTAKNLWVFLLLCTAEITRKMVRYSSKQTLTNFLFSFALSSYMYFSNDKCQISGLRIFFIYFIFGILLIKSIWLMLENSNNGDRN